MKNNYLLLAILFCSFSMKAQPVLTKYGLFDDFSTTKIKGSDAVSGRSLIWTTYNDVEQTLTRDSANKRLQVRTTQEKENYHSFGVSFGKDKEGKPYTIDLSANGKFSFDITNTGTEGLNVRISCIDTNGRQEDCSAGAIWVNPWNYQWQVIVAAGRTVTFKDGTPNNAGGMINNDCNFATGLWGDYVNKIIRNDCDLRHIKSIQITVLNSSISRADNHAYPLLNGLLSISNFSVGDTSASASTNPKYITISAPSVVMMNTGGTNKSIAIESNIQWKDSVSSDQTWLSVSPISGKVGSDSLLFTATANTTATSRTAYVTIWGDGATARTITVPQLGQTPAISVLNSTEYFATKANSTILAKVISNVAWSAKPDTNQTWLSVSSNNGSLGVSTIQFIAQANTSTSSRVAKVTFSGTGATPKVVTLTQAGVNPPISTTEIKEVSSIDTNDEMVVVYPNPASSSFTMKTVPGTFVSICSEIGAEMISFVANTENTVIDCSSWSRGVYVAKLVDSQELKTTKILIK